MSAWRPELPKAELHCHIEAAAHPDVVRKCAEKYGVDLSGIIEDDGYKWSDFSEFIASYFAVSEVLREPEDYIALTHDYLTRQARAGVIYQEFFCSHDNAERMNCSYNAMIDAISEGIKLAKEESGIESRIIHTGVRNHNPDHVAEAAQLTADNPHPLVVGFGVAGDERHLTHKDFKRAFDIARDAGLRLTTHAGEICGPESVKEALDCFGVERIGHGVQAWDDPDLVKRLADENIVLEVCPSSNVLLTKYKSWQEHPFDNLREAGIIVTLSSDDPYFFATTTDQEYQRAQEAYGYSDAKLLDITRASINAAFCDEETKNQLLQKVDAAE